MHKVKVFVACGVAALIIASSGGAGQAQQRGGGTPALSALDFFEIQQLYSRFCHGLDSGADNGNMFAAVFAPDGVYVDANGTTYQGRERLAELARLDPDGTKGPTNVAHFTTNVTITPTSATAATGTGYLMVAGRTGGAAPAPGRGAAPAAGGRGVIDGGLYQDELVKTADGWKIRRRTLVRAAR